jgi:tetratricopeptide (TPR) repeat protein
VLRLAELYINSVPPRWQQAERVIRETREVPGLIDDPELLNAEAIVLLNQGKAAAAEPLIMQAAAKNPNSLAITQTQIDVLLALRRYDQVLAAVDNGLRRMPDMFWLHAAKGRALAAQRRNADAAESFKRGIDLALASGGNQLAQPVVLQMVERLGPDAAAAALGDRMNEPGWKITLAPLFDGAGESAKAVAMVDDLLANRSALTNIQLETALRIAGQVYQSARPPSLEKAYQAYKDLLAVRPDDFGAMNNLAFLLVTDGAPGGGAAEALTYSQKAYDIIRAAGGANPLIADTHGWVLILNGRLDDGIAILEKVIEESDIPDSFYHLAEGYFRKEMYPQAVAVLKRGKLSIEKLPQDRLDVMELNSRMDALMARARVIGGDNVAPPTGNN